MKLNLEIHEKFHLSWNNMIFIKCKPDKLLVRLITNIPRRIIEHTGNKFEVICITA